MRAIACESRGGSSVRCQHWPIGTVFWWETRGWKTPSSANPNSGTCMAAFSEGFWCGELLRLLSQRHMSSVASGLCSWKLITWISGGRYAWYLKPLFLSRSCYLSAWALQVSVLDEEELPSWACFFFFRHPGHGYEFSNWIVPPGWCWRLPSAQILCTVHRNREPGATTDSCWSDSSCHSTRIEVQRGIIPLTLLFSEKGSLSSFSFVFCWNEWQDFITTAKRNQEQQPSWVLLSFSLIRD